MTGFLASVSQRMTLVEQEHFFFFLLKLKILEAKVKFWRGTHMTLSEKILDFYKILEESEQFIIFIFF